MSHTPVFFAAPHRPLFFFGACQALLTMTWWLVDLGLRSHGLEPSWPLPGTWIHGLLMIYGFFPFFIFGFALTAGPRWQGFDETPIQVYAPAAVVAALGWVACYAGLWLAALLPVGMALVLAAWFIVLRHFYRIVSHVTSDRMHISTIALALLAAAVGQALLLVVFSGGPVALAYVALTLGVWGFLLPVYVTVCHRMIPFFSSTVIRGYKPQRPRWAFYLILVAGLAHGGLSLLGLPAWTWLADVPGAVAALYLSHLWRLWDSLEVKILAMLHLGFLWLGLALGLYAVQSLALLAGHAVLGLAPLHALTIGFFASTLLGMASRVSMGHSGRPVAADSLLWWLFVGLQTVAVLRLAADVFSGFWLSLVLAAALAWLVVFGVWVARFAPFYWRPRVDGKEG